ncbi:MAG: class I SAM-dependent methyltransferase [Chloroflexota bacterium]
MEYSFPHYLLAKQTVDDRSINQNVYQNLKSRLIQDNLRIIEVGAGIGTMLVRLLRWGFLKSPCEYVIIDDMLENIVFAKYWLPEWADKNNLSVEWLNENQLRLTNTNCDVLVTLEKSDVFDFVKNNNLMADLLIAHAFLDLLPMPESLLDLFSLLKPDGLAWMTINFDGVTTLEPPIEISLDQKIENLYHQTMDMRVSGGDSCAGRHLFSHFSKIGAQILAAGASDWVVYPSNGCYLPDEAFFLKFILYFFELSLKDHPELDQAAFDEWLAKRRIQVEQASLVYIAHQMDFLVKPKGL